MCGIVGYTGSRPAAPILLAGLSHLEYRGYDSAGLAVREGGGEIEIVKTRGRLRALYDMTNGGQALPGDCGVGHTPLGHARRALGGKRPSPVQRRPYGGGRP